MKRHFPYQHPTFGTKTRPKTEGSWKSSVYYWWWEYLKRNEDYKLTCESGGKGKCAKLYEDFGNVYTDSFKEWWSDGGRAVHLFSEPPTPSIRLLDQGSIVDGSDAAKLILEVPLNLPITFLCQSFRKIVTKLHKGKRGMRASQASQARYKVIGKVDLKFLADALAVWDYRTAHPDLPFWLIAQDTRIVPSKHWVRDSDTQAEKVDKRNILNATASRLYKKAGSIIKNVGNGIFPLASTKE